MSTCPVCRARWREAVECPRCGTNLADLMRLEVAAWRLRQEARAALRADDPRRATELAVRAQRLCATEVGETLVRVAAGRLAVASAKPLR